MTKQLKTTKQAEALVRSVLAKSFGQKVDAETLRAVAEKVARTIPASPPRKPIAEAAD